MAEKPVRGRFAKAALDTGSDVELKRAAIEATDKVSSLMPEMATADAL